jgi:hypothetical protein
VEANRHAIDRKGHELRRALADTCDTDGRRHRIERGWRVVCRSDQRDVIDQVLPAPQLTRRLRPVNTGGRPQLMQSEFRDRCRAS